MEAIFLVVHVLVAVALIGIVLIQRSSTDGFGLGSGSGSNFMTGRQTASLLTRATSILATIFILNSLWLGILATQGTQTSLVDEIEASAPAAATDTAPITVPEATEEAPAAQEEAPASAPAVPVGE